MPSINSKGAGIKKTLLSWLFHKKASFSFALIISFFIFPVLARTNIANSEQASLYSPGANLYNSQTLSLLSPKLRPSVDGPTGGREEIIVEGEALVANVRPTKDAETDKIISASDRDISVYTVRDGDTIGTIAEMFDISPNTIRWANDIDVKGTIKPGQDLVILPIAGVKHKVAKGQTIEGIAKLYKGDAREIRIFNGIEEGEGLTVGEEIIIPEGEKAEEPKVAKKSSGSKAAPSKEVAKGYYIRPVVGIKTQGPHGGFKGIDIGAKTGTPVYAMAGGTVIIAKGNGAWNGGYGNYVVVSHENGTQTLYAHLSRVDTSAGKKVSQGEVIGAVGNTGRSTGPHLHFEVRGATSAAAKLY